MSPLPCRLAIFDLDGTLLNTLGDLAASANAALAAHHLPTHPQDSIRQFVGNGIRKLIERACPANAIEGKVREAHVIDPVKCVKCGACMNTCKFGAIYKK